MVTLNGGHKYVAKVTHTHETEIGIFLSFP